MPTHRERCCQVDVHPLFGIVCIVMFAVFMFRRRTENNNCPRLSKLFSITEPTGLFHSDMKQTRRGEFYSRAARGAAPMP